MIEITNEYKIVAKEYKKKFGYGVPLCMIPPTANMSDLIYNIKECIGTGIDDLLERYNVKIEKGKLY